MRIKRNVILEQPWLASGLVSLFLVYALSRYLLGGYFFANIDVLDVIQPGLFTFYQQLRTLTLPIWNDSIGAGQILLPFGHYPLNQFSPFFLLFGFNEVTFNLSLFVSYALCVYFMWKLLRHWGVSSIVAWAGAFLYLGLPYVGQFILHVVHINCIIFAPWLLHQILLYGERRSQKRFVGVALAFACSLLSSKVDLWIFSSFLLAYAWLYFVVANRRFRRVRVQELLILGIVFLIGVFANALTLDLARIHLGESSRLLFQVGLEVLFQGGFWQEAGNAVLESPYALTFAWAFFIGILLLLLTKYLPVYRHYAVAAGHLVLVVLLLKISEINLPNQALLALLLFPVLFFREQKEPKDFFSQCLDFLFPLWLALFFYQSHSSSERLEMVPYLGIFSFPIFLLFLIPNYLVPRSREANFLRLGFLLCLFLRYHGQQILIQVLGAVWHPARDNFLIFLFLTSFSFFHLRLQRWSVQFLLLGLAFLFVEQKLFFNPRWIQSREAGASIGMLDPHASSCLEEANPFLGRILALPSMATKEANRWTSSFPFNPNRLQYLGLNDISYYDSISSRRWSNLINRLNAGDRFQFNNPVINHSFPDLILRFFPDGHRRTEKTELEKISDYSYLRLIPETVDPTILKLWGTRYVLLEGPWGEKNYPHLSLPNFSETYRELCQFTYRGPLQEIKNNFHLYELKTGAWSKVSLYPIDRVQAVEGEQACVETFFQKDHLASGQVLVESEKVSVPVNRVSVERPGLFVSIDRSEELRLQVVGEEPQFLRIARMYSPLWRATNNGKPVEILPTDCALQGFVVPAGSSEVRVWLDKTRFYYSFAVMVIVWLGLVGAWLWTRRIREEAHG